MQVNAPAGEFGLVDAMSGLVTEIERSRMRADELRAAAEAMINEAARDAMLDMADGYDRLADGLEAFRAKARTGQRA